MASKAVLGAAVLGLLVLAGCREGGEATDLPPVGEELMQIEQARCEARAGIWGRGGKEGDGGFLCFTRTRDANQVCRRSTDCEGFCLARSGTCAPVTPIFGCNEVLNEFGARSTVCVD